MTPLSRDVATTLAMLGGALKECKGRWWVIGSAAVALHGAAPIDVHDMDVLVDAAAADELFACLDLLPAPGMADGRFHSAAFGRWRRAPLVVEIMSGLQVANATGWQPVTLRTCVWHACKDVAIPTPDRAELVQLLQRFGRPKDDRRRALLEAMTVL